MKGEVGFQRYYAFLSLFTMSMLGLVVATNIFQMYLFWELVGVSSYLLIGFYYTKPAAIAASKKAFIVTRFADLGFLIGILIYGYYGGTFGFTPDTVSLISGGASMLPLALGLMFVGDVSNVISQRVVPTTTKEIYDYAKRRSAFNHPAVMYSKTAVLDAGGYADLKRNQDVDLFGRMQFLGYKAENIDEALLWFRSSDELAKRRKSWQNTWSYIATIRKFWKMGYSTFQSVQYQPLHNLQMNYIPSSKICG